MNQQTTKLQGAEWLHLLKTPPYAPVTSHTELKTGDTVRIIGNEDKIFCVVAATEKHLNMEGVEIKEAGYTIDGGYAHLVSTDSYGMVQRQVLPVRVLEKRDDSGSYEEIEKIVREWSNSDKGGVDNPKAWIDEGLNRAYEAVAALAAATQEDNDYGRGTSNGYSGAMKAIKELQTKIREEIEEDKK